jgi:hypothetical protein
MRVAVTCESCSQRHDELNEERVQSSSTRNGRLVGTAILQLYSNLSESIVKKIVVHALMQGRGHLWPAGELCRIPLALRLILLRRFSHYLCEHQVDFARSQVPADQAAVLHKLLEARPRHRRLIPDVEPIAVSTVAVVKERELAVNTGNMGQALKHMRLIVWDSCLHDKLF